MKMITPRKAALLGAIVVLLGVYIVQAIFDGRGSPRTLQASGIDSVAVEKADGTAWSLSKTGDIWTIGALDGSTDRAPADQAIARSLVESMTSVRILSVVSSGGDGERFGFSGSDVFRVTARANGKTVRMLTLGKTASVASQSYIRADASDDVLLVVGDYRSRFDITIDDLLQKTAESVPEQVLDLGEPALSTD